MINLKDIGFLKAKPGDFIKLKSKKPLAIQPNINTRVKVYPYQAYIELKGTKIKQVVKPKAPIVIKVDPFVDAFMLVPQNQVSDAIESLRKRKFIKDVISLLRRWKI